MKRSIYRRPNDKSYQVAYKDDSIRKNGTALVSGPSMEAALTTLKEENPTIEILWACLMRTDMYFEYGFDLREGR